MQSPAHLDLQAPHLSRLGGRLLLLFFELGQGRSGVRRQPTTELTCSNAMRLGAFDGADISQVDVRGRWSRLRQRARLTAVVAILRDDCAFVRDCGAAPLSEISPDR